MNECIKSPLSSKERGGGEGNKFSPSPAALRAVFLSRIGRGEKWISILFFFLLLPHLSFAAFCPTNFNQIQEGNTVDKVTQLCGKPDKTETSEMKPPAPQEWSYYIPQTVSTQTTDQAQGTLKTQITFDANGKVLNLSVNGIGVGASSICGSNIQLGDSRETVKAACGEPAFVANGQPSGQPPIQVTTFIYNTNPPTKLVFENGVLKGQ